MSLSDSIQKRIDQVVAAPEKRFADFISADLYKIAKAENALIIYSGISGHIAIRPDKSFVFWGGEGMGVEDEVEPVFQVIALISGSKQYPELNELIPERTDDAKACLDCKGSGKAFIDELHSDVTCGKCLGLGWVNREVVSLSESLICPSYEGSGDG